MVFGLLQIFDILETSSISMILQCQQYNNFMTVAILLAFSNALANKVISQTILGIV